MLSSANTNSSEILTLSSFPKAFIHVDCDSFFASVEQALEPSLKGKVVITGKERGIASAISVEGKRLGISRGMSLRDIQKMCPQAVILPSDYETYSLYSRRFYSILRRFTPEVEEYSIDEAFAELSGLRRVYHCSYPDIALKIKEAMESELGITVSIGLSLTKSLAKICSKENKPSGLKCVRGYELHEFLKKVLISRVCGFGPNSTALLLKHGVQTVWDYVQRPEAFAKKWLGKIGLELWHELRGEAVYAIANEMKAPQASLSKTKTFTPASSDREFVRAQLLRNLESAFIKLRRHHLRAGTLSIYLTDKDYKSDGLCVELSRRTASTLEAAPIATRLFDAVFKPGTRYRRTGVWLNSLDGGRETQYDLFEDACRVKKLSRVCHVVDEVNSIYGKHTLHLGSTDLLGKFSAHLGERGDQAKRKVERLKGETFRQHVNVPLWNVKV